MAYLPERARRIVEDPPAPVKRFLARLAEVEVFQQTVVLASQAFTALVPLLVVYTAIVPLGESRDFAVAVIDRFGLDGSTADTVRVAFGAGNDEGATALGLVLAVFFALAFCRSLQGLYEKTWRLEPVGIRGTPWCLAWLACLGLYLTIRPPLDEALDGLADGVVAIVLAVGLWLATPYVLLGRRVALRRMLPTGLLTAAGMTVLFVASVVWMPLSIESSASRFGAIGVAFALLSWLFVAATILILTAAAGAVLGERR